MILCSSKIILRLYEKQLTCKQAVSTYPFSFTNDHNAVVLFFTILVFSYYLLYNHWGLLICFHYHWVGSNIQVVWTLWLTSFTSIFSFSRELFAIWNVISSSGVWLLLPCVAVNIYMEHSSGDLVIMPQWISHTEKEIPWFGPCHLQLETFWIEMNFNCKELLWLIWLHHETIWCH